MEKFECRKCGTEFSKEDCYEENLCPRCGCPVDEELDSGNISLEFDLPKTFEVHGENGKLNGCYKVSEKSCFIKGETFQLTIIVEKTYGAEDSSDSDHKVVWNVEFPNNNYSCSDYEELPSLEVGETTELDIDIEAIQLGEYYLTLNIE